MNKHELVNLTLDQLLEAFKSSPESFEYEDKNYTSSKISGNPTIMWQPKIELKDNLNNIVSDPTKDQRAIMITYDEFSGAISCFLFCKSVSNLSMASGHMADASIVSRQMFSVLRSNYRKFNKLKRLIIRRDKDRENDKFLRKLNSVFPSALDKHLLG